LAKHNYKIFFLLLFLLNTNGIYSQTEPIAADSVQTDTTTFVMQKSPWGAVLRSAVIPGWGQVYNESYWKVPVVLGFLGYFSYVWIDQNKSYKHYRDLFSASITESEPSGNSNYYDYREFYRDQRNTFAIYIGLTYFLQLVDAYVDAQLFDFSVEENKFTGNMDLSIKYWIK
jgi:hypothetical protein